MRKTSIGRYAMAYLFWLITLALSLAVCAVIIESSVELMSAADLHRYPIHAVRQFMTVILGLAVLVLLIWNEHHYRTGAERGRLVERFVRMIGLSLLVMAIFHGAAGIVRNVVLTSAGMSPQWLQVSLAAVELIVAAICLWYARRSYHEYKQARWRAN